MLELYWAYEDYQSLMKFIQKILLKLIKSLKLKSTVFNRPWQTLTFNEVLKKFIDPSRRGRLDNLNADEARNFQKKFAQNLSILLLSPIIPWPLLLWPNLALKMPNWLNASSWWLTAGN